MEAVRDSWTDGRLDDLNTKVDDGFARADKKVDDGFARIDKKVDDGFARIDKKVDDGFARTDRDIRDLRSDMKDGFAAMEARFAASDARFDGLQQTLIKCAAGLVGSIILLIVTYILTGHS